uniref:Glypican n=1 Tax=Cuerna arida TaxID=1464854 RepID=A0A1B6FAD6_9HEMI
MYIVPKEKRTCFKMHLPKMFQLEKSVVCAIVLIIFQVIGLCTKEVRGDSLNCSNVKQLFESRKINITDVPKLPLPGNTGRLCSSGPSCCSEQTELLLKASLRHQHEQNIRQQLTTLSAVLKTRATKFDEFFKDLLTTAKGGFHDMFKRTYGIIYEQNSFVFTDLFEELEHYYAKGKVDLTDTMESFFNTLYQKMFTVINSHYRFDEKYLMCVSDHMKELKPFGDVPHKLSVEIKRSFVATRTFAQSLSIAGDIVNNMLNMPLTEDCSRALVKMSACPLCQGLQGKTCYNYCSNVMKGCLAHHSELNNEWNSFVDAIDKVTERLIGPFNIQMVVGPIDTKISDAVMNFQENSYTVSQRVFNGCGGKPLLGERQRRALRRTVRSNAGKELNQESLQFTGRGRQKEKAGLDLERLVKDIRMRVKDTKQFWARLPYQTCNSDPSVANGKVNETCWNGQSIGSYTHSVTGDGLSNQQNNPEVAVDVSRQNSLLNEQIFALKTITSKLKNAYNGMDVEWIDIEEFSSGSGSGDGSEGDDTEEDSGSGMEFPTERNRPEPVPDPGNDQDNQLHPLDDSGKVRHNVSSSGSSVLSSQRMSLNRALLSYLVPVVVMWFGSAISDWLQ